MISYIRRVVSVNPRRHLDRRRPRAARRLWRDAPDDHSQLLRIGRTATPVRASTTQPTCSTTATSSSPVPAPVPRPARGRPPELQVQVRRRLLSVNPGPARVTASDGSFTTYGGTPPTDHRQLLGIRKRQLGHHPHNPADVLDHGHELEHGRRLYASSCSGAADPNLTVSYSGGTVWSTHAPRSASPPRPVVHIGGAPPAITANTQAS